MGLRWIELSLIGLVGVMLGAACADDDTQPVGPSGPSGPTTTSTGGGGAGAGGAGSGGAQGGGGATSGNGGSGGGMTGGLARVVARGSAPGFVGAQVAQQPLDGCDVSMTVGACVLKQCPDMPQTPISNDAGDISISGGTNPATLTFDTGQQIYPNETVSGGIFTPGQMLTISVAGGPGVPAQSSTFETPALATLTAPDLSGFVLDRGVAVNLTWTNGGTVGEVDFRVTTLVPGVGGAEVVCRFNVTDGSATVPTSVLGGLLTTSGAVMSVVIDNVASSTNGTWRYELSAAEMMDATGGDGGKALRQTLTVQ